MYSYIHIPFCESKCDYCRFASYAGIDQLKVNFYVGFLCREIEISEIEPKKLKSIYFGGGTPTTLTPKQLERIIITLENKFGLSKNVEINLETTPENVTLKNITDWKNIGINRISMGVQSLNNRTLKEIHRKPSSEIYRAFTVLEEGIIPNVSIDFIIGLPFVKKGELQTYIAYVLENYKIMKHVSVYMLEDYYETPEEIDSKFQNVTYPVNWSKDGIREADFLEEYISIKKYLKSQKFLSYEISNFSKKGYECKHNTAYWNHKQIAAFGLGSSGFIEGWRYKNSDDFGDYYRGDNIEFDKLLEKDILLEKIMFGLRTTGVEKRYISADKEKIISLEKEDLIRISKNKIHLGEKGYTLLDTISLELI